MNLHFPNFISGGKAVALSLLAALAMAGCESHDSMYDSTKSVGNVVLSDGRIASPASYDSTRQRAVGVIFHVKGDTAFAVALGDLGMVAFSNDSSAISGVSSDAFAMDGFENSAAMIGAGESPAVLAAAQWGGSPSGWYLPAAGELMALARNVQAVERSLAAVGGAPLANDEYVSSTQDGSSAQGMALFCYCVNPHSGFVTSSLKSVPHHARAVMRFR